PAPRRSRLPCLFVATLLLAGLGAGGYLAWQQYHPAPQGPEPDRTVHLFNGKDLTNFYTYLGVPRGDKTPYGRDNDPEGVFGVHDSMIRISGQVHGCVATRDEYTNCRLVVEYKWGDRTWRPRNDKARLSGVMLHAVGADGAARGSWLESVRCQMIE